MMSFWLSDVHISYHGVYSSKKKSCLLLKNERITAKVQLLLLPFLLLTEDEVLKAYIYLPLALKIKGNKLYRLSKTEVRYLDYVWAVVGLDI